MYSSDTTASVRTRIAPSPTGENLHIGNLYTALINYAVAKKHSGQFVVRVEDTDRERFVEGAEEKILSTLRKFGIHYDESTDIGGPYAPYRQSDRLELYKKHARELIEKRKAYYCFCSKERLEKLRSEQQEKKQTPRYDKHCLQTVTDAEERVKKGEPHVIRLNVVADKKVWFDDIVRGRIEFDSREIDDQVLIKSDGFPTYHMAVVIDDNAMKISHIIRAEEWISSTPKHIILYESFGWELPIFAHVPILRNPDKSKLSKRRNPVWAQWYLEQGYLPESVLNYLSLMGWSHPEGKEIFSLNEFIETFELSDLKAVGPIFDINKLTWMNGEYIREMSDEELKKRLVEFDSKLESIDHLDEFITIAKTRMKTLAEFGLLTTPFVSPSPLTLSAENQQLREDLHSTLAGVESWDTDTILAGLKDFVTRSGKNFKYLYTILIGADHGLPLVDVFVILGKRESTEIAIMNIQKFLRSFTYASLGFVHMWNHHQNIRFHILAAIGAVILAVVLDISYLEYLFVLITIFFVVICEMMNTAIEEMTDLITTEHKKQAAVAKDVAAGAVFLASIFAIIVAGIIFLPRIYNLF